MDNRVREFFDSMRGKSVAFLGIGVSNTPLVKKFMEHGAVVTVCDKSTREKLGGVADELEALGRRCRLERII